MPGWERSEKRMPGRFPSLRLLSAVVLAGSALACESPLSSDDRNALRIAEAKWAGRAFDDYSFEIRRACFCPPVLTEWARVTVQGERVTNVVVLSTGEEVPSSEQAFFPTVDQVFTTIQNTAESEWVDRIELEFDLVSGLPTLANFVSKPNIADAGGAYYLRNLVPLPAP
jgi:hypothetical protein